MSKFDDEMARAIGKAQHWIHNPGQIGSTEYPQLCRELYTISLALTRLAALHPQRPAAKDEPR